ncbi:protein AMR3 [Plasmodium brasilianum]|uniref:Protein AMR3 n=3 Tax=Plasmodium (Plasmodium) TaxID=418103 RepID=A0A1D3TE05_PLAMA|nr:conserved Plasmodium protein, unknown function [Plasmodium malariae]KAI4834624.1 protein AMR3 [Plasmodium brasilianum]SCP03164.1 conserved Plasmodium protein, unknown function [Plasmodium malariae]
MKFILILFKLIFLLQNLKKHEKVFLVMCTSDYIVKEVSCCPNRNNKTLNFLKVGNNNYTDFFKLYMTKKFKYKYKNFVEKRIKKGRIRNEINQKLKKKNSAYIVITEKLSKLDPDQKYFKYDKNILKEYENIKDIYKNKKLGRKFNQYDYWYSSRKKEAKYNYSRHVNFTITENKFNFKNVFSYFHILEIVHEKFKNNSFYINGLQSFINKYYDPVTQKRIKYYDKIKEQIELKKKNGAVITKQNDKKQKEDECKAINKRENVNILSVLESLENTKEKQENSNEKEESGEEKQVNKYAITSKKEFFEMIKKNLSEFEYSNDVDDDGSFKLFGSSTSCILKKNGPIAYDIKNPFMKSKLSSKRRRFKERKLFDIINFKCKNRRERLMQNAVRKLSRRKLKDEKYILDPMEAM